jgi:uncharacterized repeat protein (TIGR01451 family)
MVGSPEPVLVGANLAYALSVSNAGPSPASSVTLTAALPTGVVFQSVTSSQGSCTESGGSVTCDLGGLAPNAIATLTIGVSASAPGTWVNTATVTIAEDDLDATNDTASWTSTVDPAADVRVTMVGSPEPALVGAYLAYALSVSNAGPSPASNVTLTAALPAGVVFQSATTSQGSCTESSGTVTCDLGDLAGNASAALTIGVSASLPGTWVNTAAVTSTEGDPDLTNNTVSWTSTINPATPIPATPIPATPIPASGSTAALLSPAAGRADSSGTSVPVRLPVTGRTAGGSAAMITSLLTPARPSASPPAAGVRSASGPGQLQRSTTGIALVFAGLLASAMLLGVSLGARRRRAR